MTLVERYEAGESIRKIAAAEGVGYSAVRNALLRAGVKLRPPLFPWAGNRRSESPAPAPASRSEPGMFGVPTGWEELP